MIRDKLYRLVKRFVPVSILQRLIIIYQRIGNWIKYDDYYFPTSIGIEISTFCNRRCYYCPVSKYGTTEEQMSWDVYLKILSRLREIKWKGIIDFTMFNEPFA